MKTDIHQQDANSELLLAEIITTLNDALGYWFPMSVKDGNAACEARQRVFELRDKLMKTTNKRNGNASNSFVQVTLLGQFFHSISNEDRQVEWQGVVIGNPEPGWYLLQLFEWTMGEPNVRKLVRIEDMEHWLFYEDADAMKWSYDHGAAREGGPYRKHVTA